MFRHETNGSGRHRIVFSMDPKVAGEWTDYQDIAKLITSTGAVYIAITEYYGKDSPIACNVVHQLCPMPTESVEA